MAKEKKIGIRYYLNEKLKPLDLNGQKGYPVYIQITYNRKTTRIFFPLIYGASYLTENQFESFFIERTDNNINNQIKDFEKKIQDTIKYESMLVGDDFSLKGFSKVLYFYDNSLLQTLEDQLKSEFKKFLVDKLTTEQFERVFHELMFFYDSYFLVKDNLIKDVKSKLPAKLESGFTAFIWLIAYVNTKLSKKNVDDVLKVKDWISKGFRIGFKDFILNPPNEPVFKGESPNSLTFRMLKEFPLDSTKIHNYMNAINLLISNARG